jgi:5'-AMP-activated protein kinase regulatory beta subunit
LPPGTHQLKFIVDDEWKCSQDLPIASDPEGNLVNFLTILDQSQQQTGLTETDGLEELSTWTESLTFDQTEDLSGNCDGFTTEIPDYLQKKEISGNKKENREKKLKFIDELPTGIPRHFEKVLLNHKTNSNEDPCLLPIPTHVSLNHLYACSIKDNVMAVACTCRYHEKVNFKFNLF